MKAGVSALTRETLHILDGKQCIALVETRTDLAAPEQLVRYQLGNHLGSAVLELDDAAAIISYEEYFPFGASSYQAVRSQTETPKRYRYTGKERDEENGFYYHGARYYAPWLGRWTSADPAGIVDGLNVYQYAHGSPGVLRDNNGMQADDAIAPKSYTDRCVQFNTSIDSRTGKGSYALTIELQNPSTQDRFFFNATGDFGGMVGLKQALAENSGFAQSLSSEERESLFSALESTTASAAPRKPTKPSKEVALDSGHSIDVLGIGSDVAKGLEADKVLPQRYRLEPERGSTVTGIRDTKAGKVRGVPPKPVGDAVIRFDEPHKNTNNPHINIESLGEADPHIRISPRTLAAVGKTARFLEGANRFLLPVAIGLDVARLGLAIRADQGFGRNTFRTAASIAGGWAGGFAGALAGAKAGALLGGVIGSFIPVLGTAAGAAIGGLLGGIVGGIGGAVLGSWGAEEAADRVLLNRGSLLTP